MSIQRQSDWYGESPNLPSVVPATSEVEFETSLSSVYKVIMSLFIKAFFVNRNKINLQMHYDFAIASVVKIM